MAFYYKRGDCFWVSHSQAGTRIRRALKTRDGQPVHDEKAAKYLINELENSLDRGIKPREISKQTTADILPAYTASIKNTIGPKQFKEEIKQVQRFSAHFHQSLQDITCGQIKAFLDAITWHKRKSKEPIPVSDRTWNGYLVTIKKFFKFATRHEYLQKDPSVDLKQRRMTRNPPFWLADGKDKTLLIFTSKKFPDYHAPSASGVYAGLRIGEMLNLEWPDINWSAGKRKGYIAVQNKMNWKTKNRTYRYVPMAKNLEKILRKTRKSAGYCFWEDQSRDYKKHRDVFKRICREAGMPLPDGKAFHVLRHTFGTKHGRAGTSEWKLQGWMGHNDPRTTGIYKHPDPRDKSIDLD